MKSMRIAIATADKASVCDHLARSSAFFILDIEDGRVTSRTVRERRADACGNHASFVEILKGCNAVVCGGIGQGAADSLVAHGIRPVVAAGSHSVEDAVTRYLAGTLATTTERVCLCH
jgi:predicted Fe-Mo cluster-binding NifX family protein